MKAVLIDNKISSVSQGDLLPIIGKRAHHLIKVVRIKKNELVLALDGHGFKAECSVKDVSKKELILEILSCKNYEHKKTLDLAICITKRDAFEDIVKSAVEIGFNKLIPVISKYSSRIEINNSRTDKIIESAMIQSNNPYFLKLENTIQIENLFKLFEEYEAIFYFSSNKKQSNKCINLKKSSRALIIIGPEGGLTEKEENFLENNPLIVTINLPTNILRAKTAVAVASGVVISMTK